MYFDLKFIGISVVRSSNHGFCKGRGNIAPGCEGSPSVDGGIGGLGGFREQFMDPVWTCCIAPLIRFNTWTMEKLEVNLCLVEQRPTSSPTSISFILDCHLTSDFITWLSSCSPCYPDDDWRRFSRRIWWFDSGVRASVAAHNLLKVF